VAGPSESTKPRVEITAYLILSFLAGYAELGGLVFALKHGLPIWAFPLIACAYQIGNLVPTPIMLHPALYFGAALIAIPLGVLIGPAPLLVLPYLILMSTSIQGFRDLAKQSGATSTFVKRIARMLGFGLAFTFGSKYAVLVLAATCVSTGVAISYRALRVRRVFKACWAPPNRFCLLMLVHQMHYFSYYSLVPFIFGRVHGLRPLAVCAAFILGWISYSLASRVWPRPSALVLLGGHILACVCLFLLPLSQTLLVNLFLWFLTGFGGGTVFVISDAARIAHFDAGLDLWEAFGHILGLCMCSLLIACCGTFQTAFYSAATFAASTGIAGCFIIESGHLADSMKNSRLG